MLANSVTEGLTPKVFREHIAHVGVDAKDTLV